jgi:spermidine/putrescine transport system permease protein
MSNDFWSKLNLRRLKGYFLIVPTFLFELIFFIVPLIIVFVYSFSKVDSFGRITFEFTLQNYFNVLTPEFSRTILRTLGIAVLSTLACLIIGYPVAYYIGFKAKSRQNILVMLIIIPFWLSFVARTYSIISIFSTNGILNQILTFLGFVGDKPQWLYTWYSVVFGMVYNYLPMMVLPIYASVEKLNPQYLEAAQSLGASPINAFFKVTLPLTLPGVFAGSILVFIPSVGEFLIPELLGGIEWYMIGNHLWIIFLTMGNYPLGSALSIVLILLVILITLLYIKYFAKEVELGF